MENYLRVFLYISKIFMDLAIYLRNLIKLLKIIRQTDFSTIKCQNFAQSLYNKHM